MRSNDRRASGHIDGGSALALTRRRSFQEAAMRVVAVGTFAQGNSSYTPRVTARRLLSGAALVSAVIAGSTATELAYAQAADNKTADTARAVGQAAHSVATVSYTHLRAHE